MFIYFGYALIVGVALGAWAFIGCMLGRRSYVLTAMVLSSIFASPVTSFTRGTAGAVYASDIVAMALLLGWLWPNIRSFFSRITPRWYGAFFWLMMLCLGSAILIAPLYQGQLAEAGLTQRVRSPIPGVPLPLLMAGFRVIRILLFLVFFAYSAHMIMDKDTGRLAYKLIVVAILILAVSHFLTFFGIKDMGLYLPGLEYQEAHMLGHAKSAQGRLYLVGIFVTAILLYRRKSAPIYIMALAVMVAALLFSGSRAAFVGLVAGASVLMISGKLAGRLTGVLTFVFIVFGFWLLTTLDPTRIERFSQIAQAPFGNPRWLIWRATFVYLLTHPYLLLTGVGFTNFRYALVGERIAEHAHNDTITCLTELGLIGAGLFLFYLYYLARAIRRRMRYTVRGERWEASCLAAIFVAFLVTSLFEQSYYYSFGATCMLRILAVLFGTSTALWIQQAYVESEEYDEAFLEAAAEDDYLPEISGNV